MKKIGIFYGSTTGNTEAIAEKIAKALGVDKSDVHNVATTPPSEVAAYDVILMGTSTWGAGDMQDSWYDFTDGLQALDLSGKEFAVFGCGDESMSDTFCSGMGELYDRVIKTGAKPIGEFNADGYTYDESSAERNGTMVGLVLDEVNHPDLTDKRISEWTEIISKA